MVSPTTLHTVSRRPSSELIREQLERLVASPRFVTSPRCQLLLRHVVEETLKGNAESLKERNIGIDVFRRDPAYDTNADPAVRVAVSEIRKKLAQYYYEPGNQDQVRIEMPTGSYAPQFSFAEAANGSETTNSCEPATPPAEKPLPKGETASPEADSRSAAPTASALRHRVILGAVTSICLLALLSATLWWRWAAASDPFAQFWAPLLKSKNPVLLCTGQIGSQNGTLPKAAGTATGPIMAQGPNGVYSRDLISIVFDDVVVLADLAAQLNSENKPFSIRHEANTTYEDLLKGPVVLIGSFNNAWTLHFTRAMRYSFARNSENFLWIADKENPNLKLGMQKVNQEIFGTEEYAVVARLVDSEAKQPAMIVAGVTPTATRAAGEFITNSQLLGVYMKSLPKGWQAKNIEILLRVHVVDNHAGPPQVVAQSIW